MTRATPKKRKPQTAAPVPAPELPSAAPQARAYAELFGRRIPDLVQLVEDLDLHGRRRAHQVCGVMRRALCALLALPTDARSPQKLDRLLLIATVKGAGDELAHDGGDPAQVWASYLQVIGLVRPSLYHELSAAAVQSRAAGRQGRGAQAIPVNDVLARAAALFGGVEVMPAREQIELGVKENVGPAWSLLRLVLPALGLPQGAPASAPRMRPSRP